MKTAHVILLALTATAGLRSSAFAQNPSADRATFPYSNRFTVGGGISQLLLGGFNIQAEYTTKRMVFDYSHGFNLILSGQVASANARDQNLTEKIPSTLGIGIGYRLTPGLDLRVEPKLHFYDLYYTNGRGETTSDKVATYQTATLGLGVYYRYYPFRKQPNALAGILLLPSLRYWPNIWSSLTDNKLTYVNRTTNRTETYKAATQGIAGTGGLLANITIGYTFGMHKR
ncbi:outer membrane beta-barrel protein [Spirosoma areae]